MTELCQPPEHLRVKVGLHFLKRPRDGREVVAEWMLPRGDREWRWRMNGLDWTTAVHATSDGYLYLGLVASRAEVEALCHDIDRALATCAEHLAEIARLRAALQPFADFAPADARNVPGVFTITQGMARAKRQLTMGDCYAARAALNPEGTQA